MRPSLALSIGAVFAAVPGLAFLLFPAQMMSGFGLGAPEEALIVMRDGGVTLIGVGVIDWMARNATGAPLRGILWGNIFIWVVDGAVNAWEIAAGMIPSAAAFSLVLPLVLTIVFALGLRHPSARPDQTNSV